MTVSEPFKAQSTAIFKLLKGSAAGAFPRPRALSEALIKLVPKDDVSHRYVDAKGASFFATAAIDIWLRGVHSFLVSASLSEVSPIWASVSGYYSSHYAVRGIAHLLGYFQLFRNKRIVQMTLENGRYVCEFKKKGSADGEHKLYWKLVKQNSMFINDSFFTENNPDSDSSDVRHRNHANYADHLSVYPMFRPLDEQELKDRIELISKIVFDAPPLPEFDRFPDVENVQLIAYHRIVRFRRLLDEVLGGTNRVWNVYRNPPFAADYMNFQLAEGINLVELGST